MSACGAATPSASSGAADETRSSPLAAPLPIERWLTTLDEPIVSQPSADGIVTIVGGRRMKLRADGTIALERADTARELRAAALVPTRSGVVLVAVSGDELVSFEDPLGSPRSMGRFEAGSKILGPVFGGIFVGPERTSETVGPRLLEVPSGTPLDTARFSALEPDSVAFLDEQRGVARFGSLGEFATTDGGRSWQSDATMVSELRAFLRGELATYRGDPVDETIPGPIDHAPPTAAWLVRTRVDPLRALAERGAQGPDGTAFVAVEGWLAKVDVRTGAVLDQVRLGSVGECTVTHAAKDTLLVACSQSPYGKNGVLATVSTKESPMRVVDKTEPVARGTARTSRSGGVLFTWGCGGTTAEKGDVCVRQPDGRVQGFRAPDSEALPRADGSALVAQVISGEIVVGSVGPAGSVEIARAEVPGSSVRAALLDGAAATSVVVTSSAGTFVGVVGPGMKLEKRFPPLSFETRGGAFVGIGEDRRIVVRGPDDVDFRIVEGQAPGAVRGVSPVGFNLAGERGEMLTHIGFGEVGPPPARRLDDRPAEMAVRMGRISCETLEKLDAPKVALREKLLKGVAVPDAWRVLQRDDAAAAITVVPLKKPRWKIRWISAEGAGGVHEAELDAPEGEGDRTPELRAVEVVGGWSAMIVSGWTIVAEDGHADATRGGGERAPRPAEDGTITWNQGGVHLWRRGKEPEALTTHRTYGYTSTASSAGVWVLLESGSLELRSGEGPVGLAPPLFQRTPSLRGLKNELAGTGGNAHMPACAVGSAGRTIELSGLYLQVEIDGEDLQHVAYGRVDVDLDAPVRCVARAHTATIASGRRTIDADFVGNQARLATPKGDSSLRCTWGPPVVSK